MKKIIFFLLLHVISISGAYSQVIAGSTYSGLIISNPAINFSVAATYANCSRLFDLNCDGVADMSVELYKGPTAVDGASTAYLHVLNPIFMICADTGTVQPRKTHYFNNGDPLVCPLNTNWYNDANIQLGDYGCMICPGPSSVSNLFLAYKNSTTSQIGWIKLSFDLIDAGSGTAPITLSIPQILSPCISTAIVPNSNSGTATCGIFTYNYSIQAPYCNNQCNGSIAINSLTGGTPNYTYSWSNGSTTPTVSGMCSGMYSVVFTDSQANTCTAYFNVPNPAPMTFTLNSTNVSCYGGANGSICCTNLQGGNAPFLYNWLPAGGNGTCANNLFSGTYTLCVMDQNGCQVCQNAPVVEPPLITYSLSTTNVSCFGGNNGSICCTGLTGGTPGYFYTWLPGGATGTCDNNLASASYTLCVTDSKGCQICSTAVVTQPTAIQVNELVTHASCSSCSDGNVQLQISGGTPAYTSIFSPTTPSFPGNYYYCVTDVNGCIYCDTVLVSYSSIATSIDQNTKTSLSLNIYPNPSNGEFELNYTANKIKTSIEVYDMNGRLVFINNDDKLIGENTTKVNLSKLSKGMYFIKTESGNCKIVVE
jgi:hypothetical protein